MCWTSSKPPVKRIAKEGIYTYKVIYDYGEFICYSLIIGFVYEYYKLYTQNKAIIPLCGARTNKWIIEEGFHSYRTWLTAKEAFEKFSTDPSIRKMIKIVQCIIPKGTTFYINEKKKMKLFPMVLSLPILQKYYLLRSLVIHKKRQGFQCFY